MFLSSKFERRTEDPKLALSIRNLMFTFEDMLTIPEAGIRDLLGQMDKKTLATARYTVLIWTASTIWSPAEIELMITTVFPCCKWLC